MTSCSIDSCQRRAVCRGWCQLHYERWKRNGDPGEDQPPRRYRTAQCSVDGCHRRHHANGLCTMHNQRQSLTGETGPAGMLHAPAGAGFVTNQGYHCHTGSTHPTAFARGMTLDHRVILYDLIGPGEHPCHWCSTPVCWEIRKAAPGALHVDHLDHNRLNNHPSNLVPSCVTCNSTRWRGGDAPWSPKRTPATGAA